MRRPGCSSASRDASPAAFPAGQKLVTDLEQDLTSVRQVELFAPYAGEAAQVMLDAIDAGGGERAATIRSLFQTRITGGIVGSFEIKPSGDPTPSRSRSRSRARASSRSRRFIHRQAWSPPRG